MALIACPQCGHRVSPRAAACPSCGHPIAPPKKHRAQTVAGTIAGLGCGTVMLLIIGLIAWAVHEGGQIQEREKANPTCVSDYTKCADNKDVVEHHQSKDRMSMRVKCESAAEDIAKYGKPEFPFLPFSTYRVGRSYVDSGNAVLIENNAKFKNGFGASENVIATCFYDMRNDQASVTIAPK
jgi:zinc-ribbon domain